jgi:hypothetical protein
VELCNGRTDDTSEVSAELPVGGAPSRSGFLATPIDASPRQAFSVVLSIPGEEMPGNRSKMARRFLAVIESRVCIGATLENRTQEYPDPVRPRLSGAKLPSQESAW